MENLLLWRCMADESELISLSLARPREIPDSIPLRRLPIHPSESISKRASRSATEFIVLSKSTDIVDVFWSETFSQRDLSRLLSETMHRAMKIIFRFHSINNEDSPLCAVDIVSTTTDESFVVLIKKEREFTEFTQDAIALSSFMSAWSKTHCWARADVTRVIISSKLVGKQQHNNKRAHWASNQTVCRFNRARARFSSDF